MFAVCAFTVIKATLLYLQIKVLTPLWDTFQFINIHYKLFLIDSKGYMAQYMFMAVAELNFEFFSCQIYFTYICVVSVLVV